MDLAVERQRVDDDADIVNSDIARDRDLASLLFDLELADMRAARESLLHRIVDTGLEQARLHTFGQSARLERGPRDLLQRHALVGAGDGEAAFAEFDIGLCGLEDMCRYLAALGDDLLGRAQRRRAADHR